MENNLESPQKTKLELPAIPLLGKYAEEMKTLIQKDMCTPMFTVVLFIIANTWKQPKCPSTGMDKDMVHIYIDIYEYYSAIKKK